MDTLTNIIRDDKTGIFIDDFKIRKTDDTPPRISVHDLIKVVTGQNHRMIWDRLKKMHPEIKKLETTYKFPGRGQNETPVIEECNIKKIVDLCIAGSRMTLDHKRKICGDCTFVPMKRYTEVEIHDNISKRFIDFNPQMQYKVLVEDNNYRIDMYFPHERVAVECDENGHSAYNTLIENERTDRISKQLNCAWVRYDPYASDFDMFSLARDIQKALLREYTHASVIVT
jgi:hypothetical protein